jgi:hypothetical protein
MFLDLSTSPRVDVSATMELSIPQEIIRWVAHGAPGYVLWVFSLGLFCRIEREGISPSIPGKLHGFRST